MNRVEGTANRCAVLRVPDADELVEHDSVVVEGDVGELRAAVDVADGEDVTDRLVRRRSSTATAPRRSVGSPALSEVEAGRHWPTA